MSSFWANTLAAVVSICLPVLGVAATVAVVWLKIVLNNLKKKLQENTDITQAAKEITQAAKGSIG
jgi:hypothetical protein